MNLFRALIFRALIFRTLLLVATLSLTGLPTAHGAPTAPTPTPSASPAPLQEDDGDLRTRLSQAFKQLVVSKLIEQGPSLPEPFGSLFRFPPFMRLVQFAAKPEVFADVLNVVDSPHVWLWTMLEVGWLIAYIFLKARRIKQLHEEKAGLGRMIAERVLLYVLFWIVAALAVPYVVFGGAYGRLFFGAARAVLNL